MAVRIHTFYRLTVWLPIVVPGLVAGVTHVLGMVTTVQPVDRVVFILLASLLYGGVPYAVLAVWATCWIDNRPEAEIKGMMMRAPLLMIATFVAAAALVGLVTGQIGMFLALGALGAIVIIPVGYGYVGLVLLVRDTWGPPAV